MPKMKTSRSAAKRFKVTGTGKLKRAKALTDCFATLYCFDLAPLYPFASFNTLLCFFFAFKPPFYESTGFLICWQKREKAPVQKTLDCTYQRSSENEWFILQQNDAWINSKIPS